MTRYLLSKLPVLLLLLLTLGACDNASVPKASKQRIQIGLIAPDQSSAFFQVVHAGAKNAAQVYSNQGGVEVHVSWATPLEADARKQAEAIDHLVSLGVQGIAVACIDSEVLTPAINRAVEKGIPVVTIDSDAPQSKRLAHIGTDDVAIGQSVMAELARVLGDEGTVAMLCGDEKSPGLKLRRQGAMDELARHPGIKLIEGGQVFSRENPEAAAKAINAFQAQHPEVRGWAIMGGWPLFTRDALQWEPGRIKVVSVDALPEMLPYLVSDHVSALYSQDPYGMGDKAVELLVAKIMKNTEPPARVKTDITKVTNENLAEFATQWSERLLAPDQGVDGVAK